MSADDSDFDRIYGQLKPGLVIAAADWDSFDVLKSFCYSIKACALRRGTNAMFIVWSGDPAAWPRRAREYVRRFIERHQPRGVRVFLFNEPMSHSAEILDIFREEAARAQVCLISTATVSSLTSENEHSSKRSSNSVFQEINRRISLGAWNGVLLIRARSTDDWYKAKVCLGESGPSKTYGPLYFLDKCPPNPDQSSPIPTAAEPNVRARSVFRSLLGKWIK